MIRDEPRAVKPGQAVVSARPKIAVGRLRDGSDGAAGQIVFGVPVVNKIVHWLGENRRHQQNRRGHERSKNEAALENWDFWVSQRYGYSAADGKNQRKGFVDRFGAWLVSSRSAHGKRKGFRKFKSLFCWQKCCGLRQPALRQNQEIADAIRDFAAWRASAGQPIGHPYPIAARRRCCRLRMHSWHSG